MGTIDHLALLGAEVEAMTASLRDADPTAQVPACPGWKVADLVAHVTAVHRWARLALDSDSPPSYQEEALEGSLAEAYGEAGTRLVERLTELPADAPCWTFDKTNRTASFWRRRQLHELTVHHWDVRPHDIDDATAGDGITEVVDFFLPRQAALGRTQLPAGTVQLLAGDRAWTLLEGDGPAATLHGSPADLLLLLWGRKGLGDVAVEGDRAFADAVWAAGLTP